LRIHIKINTGMNRLGEDFCHVSETEAVFRFKNLRVTGIFTHLCASDSLEPDDVAFTNRQIQDFYSLLNKLKAGGLLLPKIHIQSSYGVLNYLELKCDYARIGIALYGVLSKPGERTRLSPDLKPVLSLKSRVSLIRPVNAGESVGYGREFTARKESRIAVVTAGFADGVPRSLSSGKGFVLIGGRRAPIAGRICMDQFMADVTGIPDVKEGDVVTLIGRDGSEEISAEQAAGAAGTITNELLSRVGGRLKRVYKTN
jgi:serine/alanine racemase